MKVRVELTARRYGQFLDAVSQKSFAYALLKNGVVESITARRKRVVIVCDYKQARRLLARAARVCPEAAEEILASAHLWER